MTPHPRTGSQSLLLYNILIVIGVSVLINFLALVFAANELVMAGWYVWRFLFWPLCFFLLGSFVCSMVLLRARETAWSVIRLHAAIFALLCVTLPVSLSLINRIPLGRTLTTWKGTLAPTQPLSMGEYKSLVASSDELGPYLMFKSKTAGIAQEFEGWVIKGFMGVPIWAAPKIVDNDGKLLVPDIE